MIGIDPGLKGAIAWYRGPKFPLVVWDMPLTPYRAKNEVDAHELACILSIAPLDVPVMVEEVGPFPHDGVVSAFRFGTGYGQILGVCGAQHRKIYRVKPVVWKTLLGLSRDKAASIKLARHTFPDYDFKNNDGQAEAALLAKLGYDKFVAIAQKDE